MPVFLHVGCGAKTKQRTTAAFAGPEWSEIRLDIDPAVRPDIQGTMTDLGSVASASVDAIFSSHNIEHLYPHEVPKALAEFHRVLNSRGFLVVTCPDLRSVAQMVAEDRLTDVAYQSAVGPITPLDMMYGHRPQLANGNLFMAHRCGFTQKVLVGTLRAAGFRGVVSQSRAAPYFDLWALATKADCSENEIRSLAAGHFPSDGHVRSPSSTEGQTSS